MLVMNAEQAVEGKSSWMSPNPVLSVYVPRAAKVRAHGERYAEISTVISIISVESSIRWMVGRCEF